MTQTPGWNRPASTERDPLRPFGEQPPPPVSVDEFAAPPRTCRWWILIVGAVLLLAGIVAVPNLLPSPTPTTAPTSTPAITVVPAPTAGNQTPTAPSPGGQTSSIPFDTGAASGRWSITSSQWTTRGLLVDMTLRVDKGELGFSFFSFDNAGSAVVEPAYGSVAGELRPGRLTTGEVAVGKVLFPIKRSDTTVLLANASGKQITALLVKA